jgi:hypothetical protein
MAGIDIRRRGIPDQLAYLAGKLREGEDPQAVAFTLDTLADQVRTEEGGQ